MKIEIKDAKVNTHSGNKDGRPFEIRTQEGWLHNPSKAYPQEINISLKKDQPPWSPGNYELEVDSSLYVGNFGRLMMGSPHLVKVK